MEEKRKRRLTPWMAGVLIAVLAILGLELYHASFPVEAGGGNLAACIAAFYDQNQGRSTALSPRVTLYESVTLGRQTYVRMALNEQEGVAVLKQGLTGRYRIERLHDGSTAFYSELVEDGGKKYVLLCGRNPGAAFAGMTFTLEGFTYHMEIPEQPHFMAWIEVDPRIEADHLDGNQLTFYDAQGGPLNGENLWSSGGI